MTKRTKYTAKFSNGAVKTRGSVRIYRAAWHAVGTCIWGWGEMKGQERPVEQFGFSSSLGQAADNMRNETSGWHTRTFEEVVNVEEI